MFYNGFRDLYSLTDGAIIANSERVFVVPNKSSDGSSGAGG